MTAREFDARARALGYLPTAGGWRHPAAPGRVVRWVINPLTGKRLRRITLWRLRRVHREFAFAQEVRRG